MPYRARQRFAPLQKDKHEVTWSLLAVDMQTSPQVVVLVKGTPHASKNIGTEVEIGAKVKGIYIEMNFSAVEFTVANVVHWKVQAVRPTQTATAANTYYQTDRSQTLKRGMEMLPLGDATTVFKRIVYVDLLNFHRIADAMTIEIMCETSSTQTINWCGFGIYKEIY